MLLCGVLVLCLLTGCGGDSTQPAPSPTPTPLPDAPVSPDVVVGNVDTENTQDVQVEVQGEEQTVTLTRITGSFAADGGPAFALYADTSRYQINDIGRYCYLTLRTGMSGDVYAELGFRAAVTSDDLAGTILAEYGTMMTAGDFGKTALGNHTVRYVQGETVQNIFDVYLLDTAEGCVTMVVSTTAQTEHHRNRLLATLETLEIF